MALLTEAVVTTLVSAVGRDDWSAVRAGFLRTFDEDEQQDVVTALRLDALADAVANSPEMSRDEMLADMVPRWGARLRLLVSDRPETASRLREFVASSPGLTPPTNSVRVSQVSVSAYTQLGGSINVFNAGRDVHRNS
ncbi:hypothetical protein [Streptomyces cylindrosporus]|uniref:Uncharacterized protein n=1 Tax=Streptomyces cylindrosporus TaxID=2927583 RepID=A0ABS9Y9B3_9ACTN|nr:hypothetical protein [Streptomyces cylindrosporus]MCI3273813.1 hypothetical protein [Streptomyces cylindrosporus]